MEKTRVLVVSSDAMTRSGIASIFADDTEVQIQGLLHPIEMDSSISLKEKKKEMNSWWMKHFDLLIKSGLNKKHIEAIVNEGVIQFRKGAENFLKILSKEKIPLVIISSSGLGYDSIKIFLKKNNCLYDNIHIISNSFKWDNKGNAIGFNKLVIHVFNKDEV